MLLKALNHMATPAFNWKTFATTAKSLGCIGVEFRNDLAGPLFDAEDPAQIKATMQDMGLRVLALAEVKAFNDWSAQKAEQAEALMQIAVACGAEAVSLIPRCDGNGTEDGLRQENLRTALTGLAPLLRKYALTGLVEPLGFAFSSLRSKTETIAAIDAVEGHDVFKLVHDTFHHALAKEPALFPAQTGIIHISGVTAPDLALDDMRDPHRVLVDASDRLGNLAQIAALHRAGCEAPISFEPFAPEIHALQDPAAALARSFDFISDQLTVEAAR